MSLCVVCVLMTQVPEGRAVSPPRRETAEERGGARAGGDEEEEEAERERTFLPSPDWVSYRPERTRREASLQSCRGWWEPPPGGSGGLLREGLQEKTRRGHTDQRFLTNSPEQVLRHLNS